jgi:hypothetical protein
MANGDMGVGVGDAVNENMSYYFGKMDFWTSNAFDGRRFACVSLRSIHACIHSVDRHPHTRSLFTSNAHFDFAALA